MRRLKAEIDNLNEIKLEIKEDAETNTNDGETSSEQQNIKPAKNKAIEWRESQVEQWANGCKIRQDILENILPCNGKVLHQLYCMKKEAPEFFYKSITSNKMLPTREIAMFALELDNLFHK